MSATTQANIGAALWPIGDTNRQVLTRHVALVAAGVVLLTVSAKAKIPFYPVPFTLQTMVLLLLGMSYGLRLATTTVLAYLGVGALGAPVFATGGGLAYMAGPTGGYLAGFVFAMVMMGYLGDRGWGKSVGSMIVSMSLGTIIIFACGITWLTYALAGFDKALAAGLYPFAKSEFFKIVVAIVLMPGAWHLVDKAKG